MKDNHKVLKRFLAFLLSFAMVITYMPMSVIAYSVEPGTAVADAQEISAEATQAAAPAEEEQPESTEEAAPADSEPADPAPAEEKVEAAAPDEEPVPEEPAKTEEAQPQAEAAPAEPAPAEPAAEPAEEEKQEDPEFKADTLEATSDNYKVTVTYGADAKIPDGATLKITEFAKGSDEYEAAKKELLKDELGNSPFSEFDENASDEDLEGLGMAAFDLTIYDKDGNAIEPDKDSHVQVNVELVEMPEGVDAETLAESMEIQHLNEKSGEVVVEKVATVDAQEASQVKEVGEITVENPSNVAEVEFTVDGFSTYTMTWGNRTARIHYVDTAGNSLTPTRTPTFSDANMYLIYDVEGYTYNSTHYGSRTGTAISPRIARYNSDRIYETLNGGWNYVRDDIYVVYSKTPDPTQGGSQQTIDPTQETWPSEIPSLVKNSTNNGNGTNTISLRITGPEKEVESGGKADIIVVFDRSRSMTYDMNGQQRLARAKTAINGMIDELMSTENDNIRMGLVQFSTSGSVVQPITGDPATMRSAVAGITADGGTNWEKALYEANHMSVASDRPTFVVFITDGDPTFRMSRGNISDSTVADNDINNEYYRTDNVYGTGSSDQAGRNFDFAVEEVKKIVGANKQFYAIGVSNDVAKVRTLCTDAGVDGSHAFTAANATAMAEAFEQIIAAIKTQLGYGDIKINDGITSMTSVEMKALQEIDPESFKYYRYGGEYGADYAHKTEWTAEQMAAEKCAPATYDKDTGSVQWNMGDDFQLENGVTYIVEFEAWPSQEAYDLVADLNNGLKDYESQSAEVKAQIKKLDSGEYTLLTNVPGSVGATYAQTHKTGDEVTVTTKTGNANYTETIQNLNLDEQTIGAVKEWKNDLDGRTAQPVTLIVNKDGAEYLKDDTKTTVSPDNNWTINNIFISCGFIKQEGDPLGGGAYEVKEVGHDYTIDEPDDLAYYWDLSSEDYRPMAINGVAHLLIHVDKAESGWVDGKDYFVIDNKIYKVDDQHNVLRAVNDRRSFLNLSKTVSASGENPDPDALFEYTINVTKPDNDDIYFSAWAGGYQEIDGTGITKEITDDQDKAIDASGWTGYYIASSGSTFTIKIKEGWNVRFINLPTGTTYDIQETGMDGTFRFVEATATATASAQAEQGTPGTVTDDAVSGTIDKPNNDFTVAYTNKVVGAYGELLAEKKVDYDWDDGDDAYTFTVEALNGAPAPENNTVTVSKTLPEGQTKHEASFGNIKFIEAGTYSYKVKETAGSNPAIQYDNREVTVTFTVEETGTGENKALQITDVSVAGGEGYEDFSVENAGAKATVSAAFTNKWNVTSLSGEKTWDDANNQDGYRPTAIIVTVMQKVVGAADAAWEAVKVTVDGQEQDLTARVTEGADGKWTYSFADLPRYTAEGQELVYKIVESAAADAGGDLTKYQEDYTSGEDGYEKITAEDGSVTFESDVTNTHEAELIDVTAKKIWNDYNNADGVRPTSITFQLYKTVGQTTSQVDGKTVDLSGTGNTWTGTITNLPKFEGGNEITYSFKELDDNDNPVEDGGVLAIGNNRWTAAYAGPDSEAVTTITNTISRTTVSFPVKKILSVPSGMTGPEEWEYTIAVEAQNGAPEAETMSGTINQDTA
ncbi:MAG: Cna B-type domain-containing protein, partial [Mogibacterium sp.]|nr:Cna B-type domain-containing protein [Mogibacterium sp.]